MRPVKEHRRFSKGENKGLRSYGPRGCGVGRGEGGGRKGGGIEKEGGK